MRSVSLPLIWLTLLFGPSIGWAQICQQVVITDEQQHRALVNYIQECRKERYFIDDKGVVLLTRSRDSEGRLVWNVEAIVDDRYKDNPPTHWSSFNGDVTLIYDAESHQHRLTDAQREEVLTCLQKVIKDRLYIRPYAEESWYIVEEKPGKPVLNTQTGKPLWAKRMRLTGGNARNAKKIIFNPDGTQTIIKPV